MNNKKTPNSATQSADDEAALVLRHQKKLDAQVLREWAKKEPFRRVKLVVRCFSFFFLIAAYTPGESRTSKQFREMYIYWLWNENKKSDSGFNILFQIYG